MTNPKPSNGDANQNGPHQDDSDSDSTEYDSDNESSDNNENNETWTCKKCHIVYDDKAEPQQFWICCSICSAPFDTGCLKMSKRT